MENEKEWWQETWSIRMKCQMSKFKVQINSKVQMTCRTLDPGLNLGPRLVGMEGYSESRPEASSGLHSQNPIWKFDIPWSFEI